MYLFIVSFKTNFRLTMIYLLRLNKTMVWIRNYFLNWKTKLFSFSMIFIGEITKVFLTSCRGEPIFIFYHGFYINSFFLVIFQIPLNINYKNQTSRRHSVAISPKHCRNRIDTSYLRYVICSLKSFLLKVVLHSQLLSEIEKWFQAISRQKLRHWLAEPVGQPVFWQEISWVHFSTSYKRWLQL